jgi:hypothetical protein
MESLIHYFWGLSLGNQINTLYENEQKNKMLAKKLWQVVRERTQKLKYLRFVMESLIHYFWGLSLGSQINTLYEKEQKNKMLVVSNMNGDLFWYIKNKIW